VQFFQIPLLLCLPLSQHRDANDILPAAKYWSNPFRCAHFLIPTRAMPAPRAVTSPWGLVCAVMTRAPGCFLSPHILGNRPRSVTYIPGSWKRDLVFGTVTLRVQRSSSRQAIHCAPQNSPLPVIIINQFPCHSQTLPFSNPSPSALVFVLR